MDPIGLHINLHIYDTLTVTETEPEDDTCRNISSYTITPYAENSVNTNEINIFQVQSVCDVATFLNFRNANLI
jgi:hypothetical protein